MTFLTIMIILSAFGLYIVLLELYLPDNLKTYLSYMKLIRSITSVFLHLILTFFPIALSLLMLSSLIFSKKFYSLGPWLSLN